MFELPDPSDPQGPMQLLMRLQQTHEELFEVRDLNPKVAFLFRSEDRIKAGRVILGACYIPSVQGELKPLFDQMLRAWVGEVDFLIVLSRTFWDAASELEREALVHHEALHMGQEVDKYGTPRFNAISGDPVWGLVGHDLEAFDQEVRRYGRWKSDIGSFLDAAKAGGTT